MSSVYQMQHHRQCQGSKPQGQQERGSVPAATRLSVQKHGAMAAAPDGQCAGGSTVNTQELEATEAAPDGQRARCSTTEDAKD